MVENTTRINKISGCCDVFKEVHVFGRCSNCVSSHKIGFESVTLTLENPKNNPPTSDAKNKKETVHGVRFSDFPFCFVFLRSVCTFAFIWGQSSSIKSHVKCKFYTYARSCVRPPLDFDSGCSGLCHLSGPWRQILQVLICWYST